MVENRNNTEQNFREQTGKKTRILLLGAGISALAAARRLHRHLPNADLSVWEAKNRVGGVIDTVNRDGFQFEQSTDNFITTVPYALDLCKELGLTDSLVQTNNRDRRTYVIRRGRLHPLPDGFMMLAPTKLVPMAMTPLLSPFGKLRAGLELFLPRKKDDADETIAQFARRRLGREVTERIVEPLLSGIYAGDAEKISLKATLPRFRDLEKKHRSLIIAMTKGQRAARRAKREEESGARYSLFMTLREGLSLLPEKIAENLPSGTIRFHRAAEKVQRFFDEIGRPFWRVTDTAGRSESFDAVICSVPSSHAGDLFAGTVPCAAEFYHSMEQTGCAIGSLVFREEQIKAPFAGMGFVSPTIEGGTLIAGSFSSHKYPHRAPAGYAVLRLFVGGARAPEAVDFSDDRLLAQIMSEIRPLLKIDGEPVTRELARWPLGMPQYHLGHLERLETLKKGLAEYGGLALCGNSFNGVGIPACIQSGYQAAEKIAAYLS